MQNNNANRQSCLSGSSSIGESKCIFSLIAEAIFNQYDVNATFGRFNGVYNLGTLFHKKEKNRNETTLLHLAAIKDKAGWSSVVKRLLLRGFDVNARDGSYKTALHHSICIDPGTTRSLLENGANADCRDCWGRTPLHLAVLANRLTSFCIWLLKEGGANIDPIDYLQGFTPLHYATRAGNRCIVEMLLKEGANINARSRGRNLTPLHIAASGWRDDDGLLVGLLLQYGADIEALDLDQATPLHLASKMEWGKGNSATMILLELGANVNARNKFNNTPLLLAICEGSYHIVKMILEYRPDMNDERVLALSFNCIEGEYFEQGHPSILTHNALQKYGFTLHSRNPVDSLWVALLKRNYEAAKLLIGTGIRPDLIEDNQKFLAQAISDRREDVVKLLIKSGVSVNSSIDHYQCPLNIAVELGLPSMVKILLDNGADPNRNWSEAGEGPVHSLILNGYSHAREEILRNLQEYGVDINSQDGAYETPLDQALNSSSWCGWPKTLIINGADVNIGNSTSIFKFFNLNQFFRRKAWLSMIRLISKLYIAGSYVSHYNIFLLEQSKQYGIVIGNEEIVYRAEVTKMKQHKLVYGLSLHGIFTTEDFGYLSNPVLMDKLELVDFEAFPQYGDLLQNKLKRDKRRKEDFSRAEEAFNFLVLVRGVVRQNSPRILLSELVTKIISHLDNLDRHHLTLCGQSLKKQLLK